MISSNTDLEEIRMRKFFVFAAFVLSCLQLFFNFRRRVSLTVWSFLWLPSQMVWMHFSIFLFCCTFFVAFRTDSWKWPGSAWFFLLDCQRFLFHWNFFFQKFVWIFLFNPRFSLCNYCFKSSAVRPVSPTAVMCSINQCLVRRTRSIEIWVVWDLCGWISLPLVVSYQYSFSQFQKSILQIWQHFFVEIMFFTFVSI